MITINKEKWSKYVLEKLDESINSISSSILIVIFDREDAIFALLKNTGYEILLELKGDVSKKELSDSNKSDSVGNQKKNFYAEILSQIISYDSKYSFNNIIVASPAFWKEYLIKEINSRDDTASKNISKKIIAATCSSVDPTALNEIIKRPELKTVLEKDRSSRELKLVEQLIENISKNNAAYGFDVVSQKISSGNISVLLVSESLIKKLRGEKQNNKIDTDKFAYDKLDRLMNDAELLNAEIKIISSVDAMKQLDGLSGVAALLRWKENY